MIGTIQQLCQKYGIRPSKKLGQSFLVDDNVVRMMVDAANLDADDCVVEIGPGFGTLTAEIAVHAKRVVAVEVDKRMVRASEEIGSPKIRRSNLQIVHGDILKISNEKIVGMLHNPTQPPLNFPPKADPPRAERGGERKGYKVVASLPYSITSAVLRKFTEYEPRPSLIVVMVQKEVAERVCAPPGEMSVLSVAVQYYGKPEIVDYVPRTAFWPEPEVDSAILKIAIYRGRTSGQTEVRPHVDEKRLFQIVRIGFSSRRKQLQNNLSAGLRLPREAVVDALRRAGLPPTVRAQELSVAQWFALISKI